MGRIGARGLLRAARARVGAVSGRSRSPAPASGGEPTDPFWSLLVDEASWPDPFDHYDAMRHIGPVFATQQQVFVAVGYDALTTLLKEPRAHAMADVDHPDLLGVGNHSIIRMNPPRHGEVRKCLSKGAFGPRQITRLTETIEAECARLLALGQDRGGLGAIDGYALPLAVRVIASILGLPRSYDDRLKHLGPRISRMLDPYLSPEQWETTRASSVEVLDTFRELMAERQVAPGEDMLSMMMAEVHGDVALSETEVLANAQFVLLAGFETTVGMIGSAIDILLQKPELRDELRDDPSLIGNFIEEVLRFESPVQMVQRRAVEPFDLAGTHVPQGWRVVGVIGAANRDPAMFPDPDTFDHRRSNANRHLAFLVGPHHCLGSALARLEGEIAVRMLLEAAPEMHRAGPTTRRPHLVVRGPAEVPVAF